MLPFVDVMQCQNLSVPMDVMHHVVQVESSANPYAIGVVGGRLVRQPRSLAEAVATAEMLESRGYNFSVGLTQVNRYNLGKYGVGSYAQAFDGCTNLRTGSRILSECHTRAGGDWGSAFSCYYSGNFTTGYQHGYVQKIFASIASQRAGAVTGDAIPLASAAMLGARTAMPSPGARRIVGGEGGRGAGGELSVSAVSPSTPATASPQAVGAPAKPAAPAASNGEGVVRLTRNGPVFSPSQNGPAPPAAVAPQTTQAAQVAAAQLQPADAPHPGDNAFVF